MDGLPVHSTRVHYLRRLRAVLTCTLRLLPLAAFDFSHDSCQSANFLVLIDHLSVDRIDDAH